MRRFERVWLVSEAFKEGVLATAVSEVFEWDRRHSTDSERSKSRRLISSHLILSK